MDGNLSISIPEPNLGIRDVAGSWLLPGEGGRQAWEWVSFDVRKL